LEKKLKIGVGRGSALEAYFHTTPDPVLKQVYKNNIEENLFSSLDKGVEAVMNG
jgi:hypothetical protein